MSQAVRHLVSTNSLHGVNRSKSMRFSDCGLAVQVAISGQGVILADCPAYMDTAGDELPETWQLRVKDSAQMPLLGCKNN